jgi:hypothetical protein
MLLATAALPCNKPSSRIDPPMKCQRQIGLLQTESRDVIGGLFERGNMKNIMFDMNWLNKLK